MNYVDHHLWIECFNDFVLVYVIKLYQLLYKNIDFVHGLFHKEDNKVFIGFKSVFIGPENTIRWNYNNTAINMILKSMKNKEISH